MRLFFSLAAAIALTATATVSFVRGEDAGAASLGAIHVSGGWARATPPGAAVGAAYVTVENSGAEDDMLLAAGTNAAGMVELHEVVEENGVARMRPLPQGIGLPAGETVALEPGGLHIMLMNLKSPLKAGESLPLTLRFAKAGVVDLTVPIQPVGAPAPAAGHAHH